MPGFGSKSGLGGMSAGPGGPTIVIEGVVGLAGEVTVSERSCPSCGLEVLRHQTLCPSCRSPVPTEAGPLAPSAVGTTVVFSALPPRAAGSGATAIAEPDPVRTGSVDDPTRLQPALGATAAEGANPPVLTAPVAGPAPAPGPAPPTPTATAGEPPGNTAAGLLGLLASALVGAGVFLPWFEVGEDAVSGWAASDDAKVLVALAGIATVGSALLIGGARSLALRLALLATGLAVIGLGLFDLVSVIGLDQQVALGIGPFLILSGGTLLIAAAATARSGRGQPSAAGDLPGVVRRPH